MTDRDEARLLPSPIKRTLRGYGPLLATLVLFALITGLVPTVARTTIAGDAISSGDRSELIAGQEGSVTGGGDTATGGANGTLPAKATACSDRPAQVPGDPYSPPCVAFSGDNGGATSRGVTKDEIDVSVRLSDVTDFAALFEQVAGSQVTETPDDVKRTLEGLTDYFNKTFQFYGRKINLNFFQGQGSPTQEILGNGQEQATADAVKAGRDLKVFADITAITPPYADALYREKVVNLGAPYMSREWYSARRPYSWSFTTDCSTGTENIAGYHLKRMVGRPASHAGGDLQGRPRKYGGISPENPWYQECVKSARDILVAGGKPYDVALTYALDLNRMSQQAASLVARMKSEQVTTIYCACDPILLVFLTAKATEQKYYPEWIIGAALVDTDTVGQLMDPEQWKHTWGISFLGASERVQSSYGYFAYKSVRKDEPSSTVDLLYYQMYMLAIGLQMAGPNLTPASFEQGMFSYPGGDGAGGKWKFAPRDYTTTDDAREIWWDATTISPANGRAGTWIDAAPGSRFTQGSWPSTDPRIFTR